MGEEGGVLGGTRVSGLWCRVLRVGGLLRGGDTWPACLTFGGDTKLLGGSQVPN